MARVVGEHAAGIRHVEAPLVRAEGKAVRSVEIVEHRADFAAERIDAIDAAGQLLLAARAFIIGGDAVVRIGETDGPIRRDDHVVRG
jgi:DNA-binding IclR family transcriptional regulator